MHPPVRTLSARHTFHSIPDPDLPFSCCTLNMFHDMVANNVVKIVTGSRDFDADTLESLKVFRDSIIVTVYETETGQPNKPSGEGVVAKENKNDADFRDFTPNIYVIVTVNTAEATIEESLAEVQEASPTPGTDSLKRTRDTSDEEDSNHKALRSEAASSRFPLTKDVTKYPVPPQPTVPGYQDEVKKVVSIEEGEQIRVTKEAPVVTSTPVGAPTAPGSSAPSLTEVKNPPKGPTTPHTCAIARQNIDPVQRDKARKKILNQDLRNAINFGFAQDYANEILCSQGGLVDNNRYLVIASKKRQEYPDKNSKRALLQYIERDLFLEADSLEQYCDSKSIQQRILATKWYAVLSSVPKEYL